MAKPKPSNNPETPDTKVKGKEALESALHHTLLTPESNTDAEESRNIEISRALGTLKRKQQEEDGLLILQEKAKILKMAQEMIDVTDSSEFNFRLAKISKMLTFYKPDEQEERLP